MKITMHNPVAPFVAIGQKLDFKIGKEVAGKCEIVSVDTETNAIGIELDRAAAHAFHATSDFHGRVCSVSVDCK
ncbi:hypothetical protein P4I89_08410 [Bacillus cereus]|uniref:hypothetical protein n=1 Tax=Bacillus cereus group TaxID=86661 RepID=UPI001298E801|nr:hypothetical protein [Bacillus thuringiensis]MDR5047794.1 hypothetical protein [Bacillus thuringiensis]MEB9509520.1 hypothetical protein [Bacillus cereus]MRC76477.1 hypothetical protein [Bacillus thuringiensis]